MNETQVKHFIVMERQKGTTIEELIFILHDNVCQNMRYLLS